MRSHYASVADLTEIPRALTAGDSYTLTLTYPDYPASAGWALTFAVAGPSVDTWTSTASGDAHVLTLPAAETGALDAGDYQWSLKAIRSGVVHTIERGTLVVAADLATLAAGEGVAFWQTLKASAEAALQALMDGGAMQMGMVGQRQFMFRSPKDCLQVIATCEARLSALRGGGFGTPIRFDVVGMR